MNDNKRILSDTDMLSITNIDRFRPSLRCDLFIPSYIHSLSIATEFIYNYVLSKFPNNYFATINIADKHPLDDFRRYKKGNLVTRETPAMIMSYSLQYDFNDNLLDYNLLSTNKYLRRSYWQRSFFKCPHKGLYIGMDLETMMIEYNFKFIQQTRALQIDMFNRLRKVFRIGCTETIDIDCDFHLDPLLISNIAKESGFNVDPSTESISDPWNFNKFLNSYSQMPILYKLRLINQRYEYFLRMRNLPIHLDLQESLSVDDGNQSGMMNNMYAIEMRIPIRFPAPRTFALYNEGNWTDIIKVENNQGINVISMKVADIPEENYKGWPMYAHSNYMAEENEKVVESIDIRPLFKAPVDVKIDTDLDYIIEDAIKQSIDPSIFIETAVYVNDFVQINNSGRLPIYMDWPNRKIVLPKDTTYQYFYLAIYIDRSYINSKVAELTKADSTRVIESKTPDSQENEIRKAYNENHIIEDLKSPSTNFPKPTRAKFVINKRKKVD